MISRVAIGPRPVQAQRAEYLPYKTTLRARVIDSLAEWIIYQNGFRFAPTTAPDAGDVAMNLSDKYGDARLTVENL